MGTSDAVGVLLFPAPAVSRRVDGDAGDQDDQDRVCETSWGRPAPGLCRHIPSHDRARPGFLECLLNLQFADFVRVTAAGPARGRLSLDVCRCCRCLAAERNRKVEELRAEISDLRAQLSLVTDNDASGSQSRPSDP